MRMPSGSPFAAQRNGDESPANRPLVSPFTRLVPNTPAFACVCSFRASSPVAQMSSKNCAAIALRVKYFGAAAGGARDADCRGIELPERTTQHFGQAGQVQLPPPTDCRSPRFRGSALFAMR